MINDYFKIAFRSLKQRKTRSLLTLLGIFLAILTIFVLLSLSLGLNDFVNEQFELLGTDKFFVQAKGQAGPPGASGSAVELTMDDVGVIEDVKGIEMVTYFMVGNGKLEFNDKFRYYLVMGMPVSEEHLDLIFETSDLEIEDGRFMKEGESRKIVVGYNYQHKNLFKKPLGTGDTLVINDIEFEVAGVLGAVGNPQDDQQVYISEDDFKDLFDSGDRVDFIYAQIKVGEDIKEVADRAERKLMKHRDVDEDTLDFSVSTPEELLGTFNEILNILTAFLVGIGAISVLVGGIGIANTMYTSVLERQKEIGTMKAIGAKNSDIMMIFVIESGVLGLIGGAAGIIAGIIIAKSVEYFVLVYLGSNMLRASMDPLIIFGCLAFAFIVGLVSGVIPSYQASKLKPVDALRYE
jgi:putative ABC transport system permease protein